MGDDTPGFYCNLIQAVWNDPMTQFYGLANQDRKIGQAFIYSQDGNIEENQGLHLALQRIYAHSGMWQTEDRATRGRPN